MKYSIRFDLKGSSSDTMHIRLRVSWAGVRVEMLTGMQVKKDYWLATEQKVKPTFRNNGITGASINKELLSVTAFLNDYFMRCHIANHTPSTAELRKELHAFFGTESNTTNQSFFSCIEIFKKMMSEQNGWSNGTTTKINTIRKHLYAFSPTLEFTDLNEDGLQAFLNHLLKSGLRNTTIAKDIDILKWFLRWAVKHGYSTNTAFENFKPKMKGTDGNSKEIIYLDWNELMNLYDFEFGDSHKGLEAVRDIFCFCCFTGLRYSDVAKLKVSDVKTDYISIVTQKTTDGLRIELNDYSRSLLSRYNIESTPHKRVFPVISNQKTNDYLKIIGRMVGFNEPIRIVYYAGNTRYEEVHEKWELLTSHCARRTFVVNALRLGIPAEVIMKWTGHSDFKSMKPYVKIVDELKAQEMAKFNSPKIPRK